MDGVDQEQVAVSLASRHVVLVGLVGAQLQELLGRAAAVEHPDEVAVGDEEQAVLVDRERAGRVQLERSAALGARALDGPLLPRLACHDLDLLLDVVQVDG